MRTVNIFYGSVTGLLFFFFAGVDSIGVCYGDAGDNLPPAKDVVGLYLSKKIGAMRIYFPDHRALEALRGTNIGVIVDVANSDISTLATDASAAFGWVYANIVPFSNVAIRYIAVGNEIIPSDIAQFILPAMHNIQNAINAAGLQNQIKIAIEYALFTSPGPVVTDGQLQYQNLFDAILDAFYSALEKVGAGSVRVVVSESGWPSDGGQSASPERAQTYLQNLIEHVEKGTPKRPGNIEAYIFAMFDEDKKQPQGTENHYGIFHPNKQPKYNLNF
ncbi:hypothetical protein HPP92_006439 [Vanilla planifolia]|uniref:Glucan endo-1,3-beta-D-glucosidase n=1 Tax=Vanilla planifolia TaxID=51239 RepID=A0A835RC26_VANPL|nr:hypothetical protein HPP92_006439 [Vanilla planifolia]